MDIITIIVTLVGCSYNNDPTTVPRAIHKEPQTVKLTLGFRVYTRCKRPR